MRWLVWLLGLTGVVLLAALEVFYSHTLAKVPALPSKPVPLFRPAERLRLQWWMSMARPQVTHVQPIWPWTVALGVLRLIPFTTACFAECEPEGFGLALDAAYRWSDELEERGTDGIRPGERVALAVWLTRHWNVEDLVMDELQHRSLDLQEQDIFDAARSVFGKEWAELDLASTALLKTVYDDPTRRDPWCAPEHSLEGRDWLLRASHEHGDITQDELEEALRAQPLLAPRPKQWPPCRTPCRGSGTRDCDDPP
ncbi:transglycosylase domain-containing protein [Myxococcus qinghaiensis]|uniref:transglycosylase domain-containing protein n=1 Tax=Myxococcus qinghaiensis TaxID=2906758 RepID=UPI0020A762E2|nr:transglycosylase domain-containing protein [Myxococcus qinghaiensis]MCP3165337.1 transglycosylase domain-containing protein [Myxococcus qinghaiensis]